MPTNPWPLINHILDAIEALPKTPTSTHVLINVNNELHIVPRSCVTAGQVLLFTWTPIIFAQGYSSYDTAQLERAALLAIQNGLDQNCVIHTNQADRVARPAAPEPLE